MERKVLVVCLVVGFLGLLCAVTGFSAEATRFKGSVPVLLSSCTYRRTPAYGLGITAAVAMLIAQIVISVASRCTCCCSKGPHRSKPCWPCGLVCFVFAWIATVLAFPTLLGAAILNDTYTITYGQNNSYFSSNSNFSNNVCPGIESGVFAGATALSLVSISLGIIYYLILSSEDKSVLPSTYNQGGIAMGQPQFPAPQTAGNTVFVHEDTYNRRQQVHV